MEFRNFSRGVSRGVLTSLINFNSAIYECMDFDSPGNAVALSGMPTSLVTHQSDSCTSHVN